MKDYLLYVEAKEAIINRAPWTPEEKQEVQTLVNKYPQKASKIDWNKISSLKASDVLVVLKEVSQKDVKRGRVENLVEGKDYLYKGTFKDYDVYIPLNYKASRVIANVKIGGCEGKWCTAYQMSSGHWDSYTNDKKQLFAYLVKPMDKIALQYDMYSGNLIQAWDKNDNQINNKPFQALKINSQEIANKYFGVTAEQAIRQNYLKSPFSVTNDRIAILIFNKLIEGSIKFKPGKRLYDWLMWGLKQKIARDNNGGQKVKKFIKQNFPNTPATWDTLLDHSPAFLAVIPEELNTAKRQIKTVKQYAFYSEFMKNVKPETFKYIIQKEHDLDVLKLIKDPTLKQELIKYITEHGKVFNAREVLHAGIWPSDNAILDYINSSKVGMPLNQLEDILNITNFKKFGKMVSEHIIKHALQQENDLGYASLYRLENWLKYWQPPMPAPSNQVINLIKKILHTHTPQPEDVWGTNMDVFHAHEIKKLLKKHYNIII
jgi:hypothetical protein